MKTKKQSTVKTSPALDYPSFKPNKSIEEITTDFLNAERKAQKRNGENSYIEDFAIAVNLLCHSYQDRSFSVNDVIQATRHLDTPSSEIIPLFFAWSEELKKHKRLKTLLSISSFPTYAFC